jgi:hypothetical protein
MLKAQHYLTEHESTVPVPKGLSKYGKLNPKTDSANTMNLATPITNYISFFRLV